jgi:hypothetical protein
MLAGTVIIIIIIIMTYLKHTPGSY